VFPQFFYGFFAAFSGQVFYEQWLYQIFNIIFTALPVMIYALYDQEFKRETLLSDPSKYAPGPKNENFNSRVFWKWILYGIAQAAFVFVLGFFMFNKAPQVPDGKTGDMWLEGQFIYGAVVIMVNMRILQDTYSHTFISFLFTSGSIASFYLIYYLMSLITTIEITGSYEETIKFPVYYICLVAVYLAMIPVDTLLYGLKQIEKEKQAMMEEWEKEQLRREQSLVMEPSGLAPIKKHHGFAFSGEAGHTP